MKDGSTYEEKMEKFLSLRSKGIIAEIDNIKGPDISAEDEDGNDDKVIDYIESGSEREKQGIEYAVLTYKCMFVAFFLVSAVFLAGIFFFKHKTSYFAGIATGLLTGIYYIKSLYLSVREVLNFSENDAEKAMKKQARMRLLAVGAAGGAVCAIVGRNAVYGVLAQILALKLSAYLTPAVMKFAEKRMK